MRVKFFALACGALSLVLGTSLAHADEWAEWRGPARNGLVTQSPPLASSWGKDGPKKLWETEKVLSDKLGGFGSPSIANGKVYVYVNWKTQTPIPQRLFTERSLRTMGWIPEKLPKDIEDAMEAARLSDERKALQDKTDDRKAWIDAWVKAHLTEEQMPVFGSYIQKRLDRGQGAYAFELMDKLATIRDKEFATPEELNKWFADNNFSEEWIKQTLYWIPTTKDSSEDAVMCFDATNGKQLWKVTMPGKVTDFGSSNTPTIAGDRCYVAGESTVYCLNANTGETIWKAKTPAGELTSSVLLLDGLAIIEAKMLTAFDAQTGEVRWKQPKVDGVYSSPVAWQHEGKTYIICNANNNQMVCVDPNTGDILWSEPTKSLCTPVIIGDDLVTFHSDKKTALRAYKLSSTGVTLRWSQPLADRSCSPLVYKGYVYAFGGEPKTDMVCVNLETGQLAWREPFGSWDYASPIIADGKIIVQRDGGRYLMLLQATPEKYTELARATLPILRFASPAFSDGKVILRLKEALACYDLTAEANPPAPADPAAPH